PLLTVGRNTERTGGRPPRPAGRGPGDREDQRGDDSRDSLGPFGVGGVADLRPGPRPRHRTRPGGADVLLDGGTRRNRDPGGTGHCRVAGRSGAGRERTGAHRGGRSRFGRRQPGEAGAGGGTAGFPLMRALICSRLDGIDSLEVGELPAPELRPGTVRVAVGASAVNFPDLLLIVGRYQEQPPLPFSPGMEVAGTVVEVAEDVQDFAVGDRGLGMIGHGRFAEEVEDLAVGDRVLGMVGHGGFAEEVVVSPDALVPMPGDVRFEEAAAFPIAHGTSYHALVDRASLRDGETLLVLGAAGGVGLAAVQIGKALGARVL